MRKPRLQLAFVCLLAAGCAGQQRFDPPVTEAGPPAAASNAAVQAEPSSGGALGALMQEVKGAAAPSAQRSIDESALPEETDLANSDELRVAAPPTSSVGDKGAPAVAGKKTEISSSMRVVRSARPVLDLVDGDLGATDEAPSDKVSVAASESTASRAAPEPASSTAAQDLKGGGSTDSAPAKPAGVPVLSAASQNPPQASKPVGSAAYIPATQAAKGTVATSPGIRVPPAAQPITVAALEAPKATAGVLDSAARPVGSEPAFDGAAPNAIGGAAPTRAAVPGALMLASLGPHGPDLTEGERELSQTSDYSFRDPTSWAITALKTAHRVDVYFRGRLFKSYHAVFGRNPDHSAKLWEGDLRTPEGVYTIIGKHLNSRWHYFLQLNYPNAVDRQRYDNLSARGVIPAINGRPRKVGGAIGVHGTDRPRFNRYGINWTSGCISVDNDAIDELAKLLPIGTVILIKP